MKATGIVRRIDDLGRVVIPKEIRRTMRIREGEPLEIFTDRDGGVVFKKYSPVGEIGDFSMQYAEAINRASGIPIAICDMDSVVAVAGVSKKEYLEKPISPQLSGILSSHRPYAVTEDVPAVSLTENGQKVSFLSPIVTEGSVVGAVMSIKRDGVASPDVSEKQLVSTGAYFIASQMEL